MEITTLHSIDTIYSADSVEWCPHPQFTDYFVCGTYQLEGDNSGSTSPPCRRKGRIYLYKYLYDNDQLNEIYRIETPAILDMKWLYKFDNDEAYLAVSNALGEVSVFILKSDKLEHKDALNLNPNIHNLLALSLDWEWNNITRKNIISSDSRGDVSLIDWTNTGLRKILQWNAHSFEAWICSYDKWNQNSIFTGGDDTFLHRFDIRTNDSVDKIITNSSHIAGVTCLLSHPKRENLLLTGSYDEFLRLFDTRSLNQHIAQINLKGGIWRIKSDPKDGNLLLCASMHNNFSIINLNQNSTSFDIVGEYFEHQSICYGSDWSQSNKLQDNELIMATCSFYDNKLCLSKVKI